MTDINLVKVEGLWRRVIIKSLLEHVILNLIYVISV